MRLNHLCPGNHLQGQISFQNRNSQIDIPTCWRIRKGSSLFPSAKPCRLNGFDVGVSVNTQVDKQEETNIPTLYMKILYKKSYAINACENDGSPRATE